MEHSATSRPTSFRLGSLRGFLPLNDTSISTRGQTLSSLIQNRSVGSLKELNDKFNPRKASTFEGSGLGEDGADEESEIGEGSEDQSSRYSRLEHLDRRMSTFSTRSREEQVLNLPQMRSMRLIGRSNPKYQW